MSNNVTVQKENDYVLPKVYIFIFLLKSLLPNKNVIKYGIFLAEVKLPKNSHI